MLPPSLSDQSKHGFTALSPGKFLSRLIGGVLLLDLFVMALAGLSLQAGHRQYQERAEINSMNLALVLGNKISDAIHASDVALLTVIDEYKQQRASGHVDGNALNAFIEQTRTRQPEIEGLRITDAQGVLIHGTDVIPSAKTSLADRPHYMRLHNDPHAGLVFSKPQMSRVNGKWGLSLARRIEGPNGSFAGMAMLEISLEYFSNAFALINIGPRGVVTVCDTEKSLVVRYPDPSENDRSLGCQSIPQVHREMIDAGKLAGTIATHSELDHIERTYSYNQLSHYPFYICVGLAKDDYLADWRQESAALASMAALFIVLTTITAWLIYLHWKRRLSLLKAMPEREAQLRSIIEASPVPLALNDDQQNITYLNLAFIHTFGYTLKDIPTLKTWWPQAYPDPGYRHWVATTWQAHLEKAKRETTPFDPIELNIRCKDGSVRTVLATAAPLSASFDSIHLVTLYDITERKQMEEKLDRLTTIMSEGQKLSHTGSWEYFVETNETFWSDEEFRIYGLTPAAKSPSYVELMEKHFHPDDAAFLDKTFREALQNRTIFEVENRIVRPDGSIRHIHNRGQPHFDKEGKLFKYTGATIDITEHKRNEDALRKSEALFHNYFELGQVGMAITSLEKGWLDVNRRLCEMLGYTKDELTRMTWTELTHPDDLEPDLMQFNRLLSGEIEQYAMDKRFIHKHGNIVHTHLTVACQRRPDNSVDYVIASLLDITERKKESQALREKSLLLENVLNSTSDYIFVKDRELRTILCNTAFAQALGTSPEALYGKNDIECGWDPELVLGCPEKGIRGYRQDDLEVLSGKSLKISEFANVGGTRRAFDTVKVPLRSADDNIIGLLAIARDMTERKIAEEKLAESEQRYKRLIEYSPLCIHELDIDGCLQSVNKAGLDMLALDDEKKILGVSYLKVVSKQDRERIKALMQEACNGTASHFEFMGAGNVPTFYKSCFIPIFDTSGTVTELMGLSEDITDRKKAELAMLAAKESAEALAKSKSEFLANMSHEIRTPMNAIIGLSQLALNKEVSDEVRDYLSKINISSESLLGILNDILDFSKLESGKFAIDNSPFNLVNICDNLYNLFAARAHEKYLEFEVQLEPDVPQDVVGDALRIQQILSNLIGNAIKFTEHGGVKVHIQRLETEKTQVRIRFSVTDTGIGISEEDRDKLFKPFSQVDTSITRRFGGTGLGLAISHGLLELMGSQFQVESTLRKGTTFSFELNLGIAAPRMHHEASHRLEDRKAGALGDELREKGAALSGTRILVAEDNTINQQVVKEFLTLSGVVADIASTGVEALELVGKHAYDAILMDVHMPEMGGVEATELIRKQPQFNELPIIALTAGVTQDERELCLSSGMNDFVGKPIIPDQLVETLTRWIRKAPIPPSEIGVASTSANIADTEKADINHLPGFDLANLREMLGDNEALIIKLLQTFHRDFEHCIAKIDEQLEKENYQAAKLLVHTIKGAAGNIGAEDLHVAATALDASLKQEKLDRAAYDKFKKVLLATLELLGKVG